MGKIRRFLLSGGLATLTHWLSMAILIMLGVNAWLSTCVGATFGAIINYFLQYHYTFNCKLQHRLTFPRYVLTAVFSWFMNATFFLLFYDLFDSSIMAQALTSALVAAANYILYNVGVFNAYADK